MAFNLSDHPRRYTHHCRSIGNIPDHSGTGTYDAAFADTDTRYHGCPYSDMRALPYLYFSRKGDTR